MRGSKAPTSAKQSGERGRELGIPVELRLRLAEWIDLDEVGADGFWLWLQTILPLLPDRKSSGAGPLSASRPEPDRVRELARDLVDCARERARLNMFADQYYRDNQVLARRVKALESALRTFEKTGRTAQLPPDEGTTEATDRYLPQR